MSDTENFINRWSRLKRKTTEEEKEPGALPSPAKLDDDAARKEVGAPQGSPEPAQEPPFDVASLPSIESLTAGSDIRAFLQSGVPAELAKAALRKAWTADPAIRDFVGLAENQWDFTDPTAMPGFGPLETTDDVGKLVSQAMGKLGEAAKTDPAGDISGQPETAQASPETPSPSARMTAQPLGIAARNDATARNDAQSEAERAKHKPASAALEGEGPAQAGAPLDRRTHGRALPR